MRRGTGVFGHGGQGGSLGVADPPVRLAFGSVQNYMRLGARDQRASSIVEAVYAAF